MKRQLSTQKTRTKPIAAISNACKNPDKVTTGFHVENRPLHKIEPIGRSVWA
jgi:hypothetical protein